MRGAWVPPIEQPDSQLRILLAKHKLEKEGTINEHVTAFRLRRQAQTAQPRRSSFVGSSTNVVPKRRRIR